MGKTGFTSLLFPGHRCGGTATIMEISAGQPRPSQCMCRTLSKDMIPPVDEGNTYLLLPDFLL